MATQSRDRTHANSAHSLMEYPNRGQSYSDNLPEYKGPTLPASELDSQTLHQIEGRQVAYELPGDSHTQVR